MFGLSGRFEYLECGNCGCLQLVDVPSDMSQYYPGDYYSFKRHNPLVTWLRRKWSGHAHGVVSVFGSVLDRLYFPNRAMSAVRRAKMSQNSRILDVGCGAGNLLLDLQHLGYKNLKGVDAFLTRDLEYPGNLKILRRSLESLSEPYDLIMLHHSFEHMRAPQLVLQNISRLLASDGLAIIRLPLASSYAWREFGTNWAQLDAPRHLFLHTYRSMEILAKNAGLFVWKVDQEGDDGTFWASEAYRKGLSMRDKRFPNRSALRRVLGLRSILKWRKVADEINRKSEADMVCFFLKKSRPVG
jgi:SAM-dependent methyltransferase